MNKQTKSIRRNKKNKTRKYYGGSVVVPNNNLNTATDINDSTDRNKGIIGLIGNELSGYSGKAVDYLKDKGLMLVGLQRIKQPVEPDNSSQEVDQKINEIGDAASGVASDVKNVGDKVSAAIIENINDVLKNPSVGASLNEAAKETAEIGEKLLNNFNKTVSTPEFKKETKEALDNIAQISNITLEAMDKPIDDALKKMNKIETETASSVGTSAAAAAVSFASGMPGVGTLVSGVKLVDNVSSAISNVFKAVSDAKATVSKLVEETSKNIDEGLDKLEEQKDDLSSINPEVPFNPDANFNPEVPFNPDTNFKPEATFDNLKKVGGTVSNRVKKSINQFENPISSVPVLTGGRKTRRKLFKNKGKSKRVRFVI